MARILLTGGGRGLGRLAALRLSALGHEVWLTARDPAAGQRTIDEARAATPGAAVRALPLDLGSFASIGACCDELLRGGAPLDVLFHVAGVMQQSPTRRLTADGFEETLQVNALAPLLLTERLEPLLRLSPASRAIFVSSRLHLPGSRGAPVDFDFADPNLARGYEHDRAYKNSKLAVLWVMGGFAARWAGTTLTSHAVCPGFVPLTGAESTHGALRFMMRHVLPHLPFATSPEVAAENLVFMATDPSVAANPGHLWGERHVIEASADARDETKRARFLAWAREAVRLGPAATA
jgi:NAD(P)-dependent dehydrogenase (short-subunit alcohol dehydrogenase family)